MTGNKLTEHEDGDEQTIEEVYQIQHYVVCQVCDKRLRVGGAVSAYAVRSGSHASWVVPHVRCEEHSLSLETLSTLGVCERAVLGRVGRVVDQALQLDWLVVLGQVREVSPARTKSTVEVSDAREAIREERA